MRIVSWNVNGLRAILKKDFAKVFAAFDADLFFIGESKMPDEPEKPYPFLPEGYKLYYTCSKVKKGYSGVALWAKKEPIKVTYGLRGGAYDDEGRVIVAEYPDFYFVGAYVPNSGEELKRLSFRMEYERNLRSYLSELDAHKPVVYAGDLNVAHNEIDLRNPDTNHRSAGFTDEERHAFDALLSLGFVDTFRALYPEEARYSWWSYRFHAREKGIGWRIDYFVTSSRLFPRVKKSLIMDEVLGSDHAPILLEIE